MNVFRAGQRLRQLREAKQLTQMEMAKLTGLTGQQISRIEMGAVAKPPQKDLVVIGRVFGLDPNAMAELYGHWAPTAPETRDPRMVRAERLARQLAPAARERFYHWVEFALSQAVAEVAPDPDGYFEDLRDRQAVK